MNEGPDGNRVDSERIALAIEAAEAVFRSKLTSADHSFEPTDTEEARAAVQRLGELWKEIPDSIAQALDAARSSGNLLSSDRLQGLAEIVQNADDVKASEVRFLLRPTDLLASHNGEPVRLRDVHGLATPWLSTKVGDAAAIGRFGIGLSTLRALAPTFEVHCDPYHVLIGEPTLASVQPPDLPPPFDESGWTTLRIPLPAEDLRLSDPRMRICRGRSSGRKTVWPSQQASLRDSCGRATTTRGLSAPNQGDRVLVPSGCFDCWVPRPRRDSDRTRRCTGVTQETIGGACPSR